VIQKTLRIINTSEQPDTTEGKKMAKTALTHDEKTVLIAVFAAALLVGGWAGYAAILGFAGTVVLTTTVSTILASICGLMIALMATMAVVIRKS
jgi:type III secretory pathway component EscS